MAEYNKKTVEDIDVSGKRVLVRVDFNVPLDANFKVTDDTRIIGALDTIKYLSEKGARAILVSHLGRPKNGFEEKFSMKPATARLSELLGKPVIQAADVIGDDARAKTGGLKNGEVLVLENVRFHPEEEKNDPAFAKELASLAEVYVNDAFGTAHRAHASTEGVTHYLPAVCGFLIKKEIEFMGTALSNPARPFVAILGGAKVSDKIKVIENLIDKCDSIIIGGGMAYTFVRAQGFGVGSSLCEEDKIGLAGELLKKAEARGVKFLLPLDTIVAKEFKNEAESKNVLIGEMPDGWMGLDIGPGAIKEFGAVVAEAKTVVWNGPMGVFEMPNFAVGTKEIARALSESGAISIVGGGDSAAAVEQLGFADKISHISTGGGASLEFLEGIVLPGISALLDK
ncbi:MAG: phosphoglycerate kinase [Oscillospiraceae bacterium]|nr:phosphoglycerate kinase [Oscillospiraceae bacterium]